MHCVTLDDEEIPQYINQVRAMLEEIAEKRYKYSRGLTIRILCNDIKETSEIIFEQNPLVNTIRRLEEGAKIVIDAWKDDGKIKILQIDRIEKNV